MILQNSLGSSICFPKTTVHLFSKFCSLSNEDRKLEITAISYSVSTKLYGTVTKSACLQSVVATSGPLSAVTENTKLKFHALSAADVFTRSYYLLCMNPNIGGAVLWSQRRKSMRTRTASFPSTPPSPQFSPSVHYWASFRQGLKANFSSQLHWCVSE